MSNYRFSICIPTYNRLPDLKETLSNVLSYYSNSDYVEIFVYDNGSTDGTDKYLEQMASEHKNLSVRLRGYNAGIDRNLLDCYVNAKGDYVHFLGSDDFIYEEFNNMMDKVIENDYDVHITNYVRVMVENGKEFMALNKQDVLFSEIEDLFSYVGHIVSFISTITLRKKDVNQDGLLEKYDGLCFMNVCLLIEQYAGKKGKFAYANKPAVFTTNKNKRDYSIEVFFSYRLIQCFILNAPRLRLKKLMPFFRSVTEFLFEYMVGFKKLKNVYSLTGWKLFLDFKIMKAIAIYFLKKFIIYPARSLSLYLRGCKNKEMEGKISI